MFGGHEEEAETLEELNASERRDAHIEKNAKEHSSGKVLQSRAKKHRDTWRRN